MYLTDFELQLINDQREVYNNCRDILLLSIEIYKMHIKYMKDAIRHNEYECYAIRKQWAKKDLENIRIEALQVLKYMFVYAKLG